MSLDSWPCFFDFHFFNSDLLILDPATWPSCTSGSPNAQQLLDAAQFAVALPIATHKSQPPRAHWSPTSERFEPGWVLDLKWTMQIYPLHEQILI